MYKKQLLISIGILVIFFSVGTLSIGLKLKPEIVNLSWLNLLLTGVLIFIHRPERSPSFLYYSLMVFAVGLLVEIIGVSSGFPFGSYHYGNALGTKLLGVPLILGLNWWILAYSSIHISMLISKKKAIRVLLAPALMLGMDMLIEPLCSKLDFWYWQDPEIPIQNYWSWYFIGLGLIAIYLSTFKTSKINPLAVTAFIVQLVFFSTLNLLL